MKYQKTRHLLAGALTIILTLTMVLGLSAPLMTQAASNVRLSSTTKIKTNVTARELTTLKISDDTKPATLESFIFKDEGTPNIVNLSKLTVKAFDQYEDEWTDLSDVRWHIDFIGEKAEDSFSDYLLANKLPIDKAGIYKIQARARKGRVVYAESNVLELVVRPARKLAKLEISDNANPATLASFVYKDKGTPESIDLSKLSVKVMDQYDDTYADTSKVIWVVELDGQSVDFPELAMNELPIQKAGTYTIWAKYGNDIVSNKLNLEVKEARKLESLHIETELEKNGIDIGAFYASDLKKDVKVTALDQYGDEYDWTKEEYQWLTGGKYSKVTGDTLLGLEKGFDTLQLVVGKDGNKVESNIVDFEIVIKPYVKELYTGDSAVVREGEDYDLTKVNFTAKDQNGDTYTFSQKEIDSIKWELTDKGTIKSTQVAFDASKKTLSVAEGTLEYGETGNVILNGAFINKNGIEAQAAQFVVTVRQNPVLDTLKLEKKDAKSILKSGEDTYVDEYFIIKGLDQYGEAYGLDKVDFTWVSDNERAFRFENNKVIVAVESGKKANVTVSAINTLNKNVMSNAVELSVPTASIQKITATGIKLNKNSLALAPKKSKALKATVSPANSTDKLSWKSSNSKIASVNKAGKVTAKAPGKAVITVITESGKKASCNVTVGLRKGDVISNGIYRYQVTNARVDGTGRMKVLGFVKGRSAQRVAIPKSVTWNGIKYNVVAVGLKAFQMNKKIKTVIIPDSVERISHKAFYRCTNMKKLIIGKNVSYLGAHAFCNNKKITKIVFAGTKLKTLKDPHIFICVNRAKVYVPKSKYKVYKKGLAVYGLGKCEFVKK